MHVAGIAAANSDQLKGVAPDAQLAIMRVFGDVRPGTDGSIYNRAINDAVAIGADAINISIGEPSVSEKRMNLSTISALQNAQKAGVVVSIAAGNSGFSGFQLADRPKANYPDYGTHSAPGSIDLSLSVASVNNQRVPYKSIQLSSNGGVAPRVIHYMDSGVRQLSDAYVDCIHVGYGYKEDYQGKTVRNKYVLIKRGDEKGTESFRFDAKINIAEQHGAIGAIVYDNEKDDELMVMEVKKTKIPSAFIGKDDGEYLAKRLEEHTAPQVLFGKNYNFADHSDQPIRKSDFSSWGVTQEGELKPDIAVPGGKIYSSLNEGFGVMSGTSMAAPHVTGAIAMVNEYVSTQFPDIQKEAKHALIKNLLMSTAKPIKEAETDAL